MPKPKEPKPADAPPPKVPTMTVIPTDGVSVTVPAESDDEPGPKETDHADQS